MSRCLVLLLVASSLIWGEAVFAQPIEIDFWGVWGGQSFEIEQGVIAEFNRLYEGRIKVTGVEVPEGADAKLAAAVAGGAPPAVIKINRPFMGEYAAKGLLQVLDDLIARDNYDVDAHYPATRGETIFEGKTYAIPWNTDNRGMYYHVGLFEEAGLDANTPPRTWEEVNEAARKLDRWDATGALSQVAFAPHWGNWYFVGWLWAAGGSLLDESNRRVTWNDEAGVKALTWMKERLDIYGGAAAFDQFLSQVAGGVFTGRKVAMVMDGSWTLGGLREQGLESEFRMAFPPRPAGLEETPVTWSGGFALAIPTGVNGAAREAAWEFIKFYSGHDAQVILGSRTGQIPTLRSAASSDEFLGSAPQMDVFVQLMQHSRWLPAIPNGAEMWGLYTDQIHSLLAAGEMPVVQILNETARIGQARLDEAWARLGN